MTSTPSPSPSPRPWAGLRPFRVTYNWRHKENKPWFVKDKDGNVISCSIKKETVQMICDALNAPDVDVTPTNVEGSSALEALGKLLTEICWMDSEFEYGDPVSANHVGKVIKEARVAYEVARAEAQLHAL